MRILVFDNNYQTCPVPFEISLTNFTVGSSKSSVAVAVILIDSIYTLSIETRLVGTLVEVTGTVEACEARSAETTEAVDKVHAGATLTTRETTAFVVI